jgi:hypothetical protein
MTDTRKPIQQETDPADTIKAIIHDKGFKISSMKRSFYKKQFAPAGLTRLIVRIKGKRMLYEGADWILISDDDEKNQESENEIIKRLFNKYINKNEKN